ncbi:energy-coupling factor ABC transporter ATP-binding protein [Treponema denticola]|uniref:Energy-coupling factor ABC transporter ATP-binding protein n=1 Tax=Treponema denticola TaxID=158 RepID=A0A9Q9BM47_TREDN|nr:energy-coupling factor ABC transporter ATP-binding protein [Treponema denticola]UTC91205.1 energy-coupling factor ABC transporter ATP-binding protein [Treponema denticola]UTC99442.1 energy-coupling factor ABC transporter ATP-binding protein [Treponema denticola]
MINLNDVSYQYNGAVVQAIQHISLSVKKGELVVITGKSGCGKTTLFRCVNGLCPRFYEGEITGTLTLNGKVLSSMRICDISNIAASVFQNPESQFFTTDVLSDLVYPCENYGIEKEEIQERLNRVTKLLSLEPLLNRKLSELSGGEKQKIAIASVLMLDTRVVLMDEPSSNLDYQSVELLTQILAQLKSKGYTILIIEHRLHYLAELCDRLIVMENGSIVREYEKDSLCTIGNDEFHKQGLRGLHLFQNTIDIPYSQKPQKKSEALVVLHDIHFAYRKNTEVLKGIHLSIYPGDKIALIGKNGCGKTTLGKILCGLKKEQSGTVLLDGRAFPARVRSKTAGYVMQNVDFQLFGCSVYDDLLLGNEALPDKENRIQTVLTKLGLSALQEQHPTTLSMGQKQRLVVAASFLQNKRLTIFDEPTSGLDYGSMRNVCALIDSITGKTNASVIITHDYEFILNTCNRAVLLEDGRITEDFQLNGSMQLEYIFKERL